MGIFAAHGMGISDDTDACSDTFSADIADTCTCAWWGVAAPL